MSSDISGWSVCFRMDCLRVRKCCYLHTEHISKVVYCWYDLHKPPGDSCLWVGCSTCLTYCPFHYPGVCAETPLLPLKEKLNLLFLRNSILPLKQLVLVLNKKCTVIAGYCTPNLYPSRAVKGNKNPYNLASIWDQLLHPVLMFWAICPSKEPSVKSLHILGFC